MEQNRHINFILPSLVQFSLLSVLNPLVCEGTKKQANNKCIYDRHDRLFIA